MKNIPLISVVMPVYNAEKYLDESIQSILNQTYGDFEFIILNDGSTDGTEEIIMSYDDPRIIYIKNEENLGIVETLNKGIDLAKGKYIARMDADDISLSQRFEKQISILENNQNIGIVGSVVEVLRDNVKSELWYLPVSNPEIQFSSIFRTPFIHPSVILRSSVLQQNNIRYSDAFPYAEDYKMWIDILRYCEGYNIPFPLLKYRIVEESLTRQAEQKLIQRKKIKLKLYQLGLDRLGVHNNQENNAQHYAIANYETVSIHKVFDYFEKLNMRICHKSIPIQIKKEILGQIWIQTLLRGKCYSGIFNRYTFYGFIYYLKRGLRIVVGRNT